MKHALRLLAGAPVALLLAASACAQAQPTGSSGSPAVATAAPVVATSAPAAAPTSPPPAATSAATPAGNPTRTISATPAQQMEEAAKKIDDAIAAAQAGDLARAKAAYDDYDKEWQVVEDGVREKSRDAYQAIEDAMDEVQIAIVKPASPDKAAAVAALQKLRQTIDAQKPKLS